MKNKKAHSGAVDFCRLGCKGKLFKEQMCLKAIGRREEEKRQKQGRNVSCFAEPTGPVPAKETPK